MSAVFDALADDYDRHFSHSPVGRRMRAVTWQRCDALFAPGSSVLEINCGTGEDAVHLAARGVRVTATDASPAMVAVAEAKITAASLAADVTVRCMPIESIDVSLGSFDGLLSNFGGLNCVEDLRATALQLAAVVRPGGVALLNVMGPLVPWEWAWFLAHGDRRRAFRRLHRGGAAWRGATIRYPSPATLRRAFAPAFTVTRIAGLGALLPPPFAESWARRHSRATDWLDRIERRVDTWRVVYSLADHYVVEMVRGNA